MDKDKAFQWLNNEVLEGGVPQACGSLARYGFDPAEVEHWLVNLGIDQTTDELLAAGFDLIDQPAQDLVAQVEPEVQLPPETVA